MKPGAVHPDRNAVSVRLDIEESRVDGAEEANRLDIRERPVLHLHGRHLIGRASAGKQFAMRSRSRCTGSITVSRAGSLLSTR
jgi:hypothetical protein